MSKVCGGCGLTKDLVEYHKSGWSPDGRHSLCNVCRAALSKARRADPDVRAVESAAGKAYYAANRERTLARQKARRAILRAAGTLPKMIWTDESRELQRARCRAWAKAHPKEMRAIVATRRARRLAADGKYTPADIELLGTEQAGVCVYCPAQLADGYHVDHIIPLSKGGSNWPSNLQLLCPLCNRRKGAKLPAEFERAAA